MEISRAIRPSARVAASASPVPEETPRPIDSYRPQKGARLMNELLPLAGGLFGTTLGAATGISAGALTAAKLDGSGGKLTAALAKPGSSLLGSLWQSMSPTTQVATIAGATVLGAAGCALGVSAGLHWVDTGAMPWSDQSATPLANFGQVEQNWTSNSDFFDLLS